MNKPPTPVTLMHVEQTLRSMRFVYESKGGQRLVLYYVHEVSGTTVTALAYESERAWTTGRSQHVGGAKGNYPPEVMLERLGYTLVSEKGAEM